MEGRNDQTDADVKYDTELTFPDCPGSCAHMVADTGDCVLKGLCKVRVDKRGVRLGIPSHWDGVARRGKLGCEHCSTQYNKPGDWAEGSPHEFRVSAKSLYYYDSQNGWEGEVIKFCPWCGRIL